MYTLQVQVNMEVTKYLFVALIQSYLIIRVCSLNLQVGFHFTVISKFYSDIIIFVVFNLSLGDIKWGHLSAAIYFLVVDLLVLLGLGHEP